MRTAEIVRKTSETDIALSLSLDGTGAYSIATGCGFLDHMLSLFAKHSGIDLTVKCIGDTQVDYHHTVEDIGITLGCAIKQALGEKRGISRYGYMLLPMDEALVMAAIDLGGRCCLRYNLSLLSSRVGDFDTELAEEFFIAFCRAAECNLHLRQLDGTNTHHILEAVFKATARALRMAVQVDTAAPNSIPSTKGTL